VVAQLVGGAELRLSTVVDLRGRTLATWAVGVLLGGVIQLVFVKETTVLVRWVVLAELLLHELGWAVRCVVPNLLLPAVVQAFL
jgi:hypothetical protein